MKSIIYCIHSIFARLVLPNRGRLGWAILLTLFLQTCSEMGLLGQTIIVPNEFAEKDGNTFNITGSAHDVGGVRDMGIIDASQFAALSGPSYLTRIVYRGDWTGSPTGPRVGIIKIFASTTKRSVANLSTTFAQNLGADNTLIFQGTLTMTTSNLLAAGNTRQFDIVVPLTTPFLYDPAAGNLVLDHQISDDAGPPIGWDAVSGHPMVRDVWAIGSATATNGQFESGTVPVTQFTFEPPPRVTARVSQVEVCWESVANATYRVEWSSHLAAHTWTALVNCYRSTGTTACITDAVVNGEPSKFYRVVRTGCVP